MFFQHRVKRTALEHRVWHDGHPRITADGLLSFTRSFVDIFSRRMVNTIAGRIKQNEGILACREANGLFTLDAIRLIIFQFPLGADSVAWPALHQQLCEGTAYREVEVPEVQEVPDVREEVAGALVPQAPPEELVQSLVPF